MIPQMPQEGVFGTRRKWRGAGGNTTWYKRYNDRGKRKTERRGQVKGHKRKMTERKRKAKGHEKKIKGCNRTTIWQNNQNEGNERAQKRN